MARHNSTKRGGLRASHRYRCRECRRQGRKYHFTKLSSSNYKGPVRCTRCASEDVLDYEKTYAKTQTNRMPPGKRCLCGRVPFPHKEKSHVLCTYYPHQYPMSEELINELEELERRLLSNKGRTREF